MTVSKCDSCGTKSERIDNFRNLQLSCPKNPKDQSITTLIHYYLQPEKLDGDNQYHCDTCNTPTDSEKVTLIIEPHFRLILIVKHLTWL